MASHKQLTKLLETRNLPKYGTKVQMQERLNKVKVFKLTIAVLQEVCRTYGLRMWKTQDQLRQALSKGNILWEFDTTTGTVLHHKNDEYRIRYMTTSDGVTTPVESHEEHSPMETDSPINQSAFTQEDSPEETHSPINQSAFTQEDSPMETDSPINQSAFTQEDSPEETHSPINQSAFTENYHMNDINLDGAVEGDEQLDVSAYVDKGNCGFTCKICGAQSAYLRHISRHVKVMHFKDQCEYKMCPNCSETLCVNSRSYERHMQRGHIHLAEQMIIEKDEDIDNPFRLLKYVPEFHKIVFQVVAIPWMDDAGEMVQTSIGITKAGNVEHYASRIWASVKGALKKRQIKVVSCGSAVNFAANHNVIMYPEGAFPLEIFCSELIVANKVKGYCREVLDSIKHISSNDVFGFLNVVEAHILEKICSVMMAGKLPKHNADLLLATLNNEPVQLCEFNRRKFDGGLIKSVLDFLDLNENIE